MIHFFCAGDTRQSPNSNMYRSVDLNQTNFPQLILEHFSLISLLNSFTLRRSVTTVPRINIAS